MAHPEPGRAPEVTVLIPTRDRWSLLSRNALRAALGQENASIWVLNGGGQQGEAASLAAYLEYFGLTASAPNGHPDTSGLSKTRVVVYNGAEARLPETIAFLEKKFNIQVELKQDAAVRVDIIVTVGSATPNLTQPPTS